MFLRNSVTYTESTLNVLKDGITHYPFCVKGKYFKAHTKHSTRGHQRLIYGAFGTPSKKLI